MEIGPGILELFLCILYHYIIVFYINYYLIRVTHAQSQSPDSFKKLTTQTLLTIYYEAFLPWVIARNNAKPNARQFDKKPSNQTQTNLIG